MSDGPVHGFPLDGAGGVRRIGLPEAAAAGTGSLWVHLDYSEPDSREWIPRENGVIAFQVWLFRRWKWL